MNYEDDVETARATIRRELRFALEREAHRYGFVGSGEELYHPELGLTLSITCKPNHTA